MSKMVKEMMMQVLRDRLGENRDILVLDSSKLDAISTNKLRRELKKADIQAMVVPNALAKRTLSDAGLTALEPYLKGPSTIVWGGRDVVALSKEIAKWAKEIEKLQIKGGAVEGKSINAAEVDQLSKSPGREELLSKIVGIILGPAGRIAGALLGPGGTVVGQLKSKAEEKADGEATPAAE